MRARQLVIPPKVAEVGEPLEEELAGYWKYGVRRYRIIYRVIRPGKALRILAVGERRSIYEEAAELLRSQK